MAGPGIRYLWFARELARRGHEVLLVVPFATDLRERGFEIVVDNLWHSRRMTELARGHDAVVAQRLPVPTMLSLAGSQTRTVYDLYSPLTIEHAALARDAGGEAGTEFALNQLALRVALETGDAFVCASERQRDLWLGALTAVGRVEPERYRRDPSFRSLVGVVPFGIDPEAPSAAAPVLKGVVPGIAASDRVALWGGGIWDWLDPLTVIRAVGRLARPDVKLYFLGSRHPNPAVPEMSMHDRAVALADELGLRGDTVFFNERWVPYAERAAYLCEADVGVSAHPDELESRFAFRTRLMDCIWAGLPIVTSGGDALSEIVRERVLGRVAEPEDVEAYAEALASVLEAGKAPFAAALAETGRAYEWSRVVEPLERLLDEAVRMPRPNVARSARVARTARYGALRVTHAVEQRGVVGTATRLAGGAPRRG